MTFILVLLQDVLIHFISIQLCTRFEQLTSAPYEEMLYILTLCNVYLKLKYRFVSGQINQILHPLIQTKEDV